MNVYDTIEIRAKAGDTRAMIAYALLEISDALSKLATKHADIDGSLQFIGTALDKLSAAASDMTVTVTMAD